MRSLALQTVVAWLLLSLAQADPFGGVELRVLPLGDSITWGFFSPDYNGYRLRFYNNVHNAGTKINHVGSLQVGTMTDNDVEGHIEAPISDISTFADNGLAFQPNVILLHAGTNDLTVNPKHEDESQAPARLTSLIDKLLNAKDALGLPLSATVIVAKIIHNADPVADAKIQQFNGQIDTILAQKFPNQKVISVDMSVIQASQTMDGTHPNEAAYLQMGDIWYQGLLSIANKGWITLALPTEPGDPILKRGPTKLQAGKRFKA